MPCVEIRFSVFADRRSRDASGAGAVGFIEPCSHRLRELVKRLLAFPAEVAEAAAKRAPHRIASYALELAQAFTAFYRDCPVLKAEPPGLRELRLQECVAAQRTIARALGLLGVSAPDSM